MHNYDAFKADLIIYIVTVCIVASAFFAIGNILFFVLKLTKVFHEPKVWILINLVGMIILLANITPVYLDITQSSYLEINGVVSVETDNRKYGDHILITDTSGQIYTCRNYFFDENTLDELEYPTIIVYAQHSKLILSVHPQTLLEQNK